MDRKFILKFCIISGIISLFQFFGGFIIAGFIPPLSPALDAAHAAAIYQAHQTRILLGASVWMMSAVFMTPFIGVISDQMARIRNLPPAVYFGQIAGGALAVVFFLLSPMLLAVTAYRTGRPIDITYALSDLTWIAIVLPWPGASAQSLMIGLGILADKDAQPIFPRWVGWYNLFAAIGYAVAIPLVFVTTGPFAWNGLLPFWFAGIVFAAWFWVMVWALWRAVGKAAAV